MPSVVFSRITVLQSRSRARKRQEIVATRNAKKRNARTRYSTQSAPAKKIREISKEIEQLFKDFLAEMEVDRCLSPPLLLPPDSDGVSCSSSEDASPLLSPRSDAGLRSRSPLSGEASAASLSPHSDVGIRRRADTDRSPIDEELTASSMGACSVSADCSFPLQDRSEDAHHLKAA
eukprot:TRINITY_DN26967_c1_g1_i1.p2 TRINITY_DN26967_c1_g1~~TRINITY_DN26967_c1_g1_i1.p2  ORF type:complete len:176 (-),score=14.12 TRINITY_DN26967_c1_g1_i1:367-894(-)